jgi:hypothetical protein
MGASNLVPLVILFLVVAGMGWVGYQVRPSPHTSTPTPITPHPRLSYPKLLYPKLSSRLTDLP